MSRARDLADIWNQGQLVDITSSFTRDSAWVKSGTERVLHNPSNGLVFYNLGLYITGTVYGADGNSSVWDLPVDNDVMYTIASAYRPSEQFITNTSNNSPARPFEGANAVVFNTNGDVTISEPINTVANDPNFRVYINGWYKI
jgi:hypothetical protein